MEKGASLMKKVNYNIGLDIGTNSVGWVATDENTRLIKHKGKNTWGVNIFEEGETASVRRIHRSTRRRLARRRQRIEKLQEIFAEEIYKTDENFFTRLKESFLYTEDKSIFSPSVLFNDKNYTDRDYHKSYPTVYHLRKDLMDTKERKDIRLIYLAIHNILKYRGNFLYGKGELSKASGNIDKEIEYIFLNLFDNYEMLNIDFQGIKKILSSNEKKGDKQDLLKKLLSNRDKNIKNKINEVIKAILGYKFSLVKVFDLEDEDKFKSISFKDDNDEVEIEDKLGEQIEIFNSIKNIYSWVVLEELLGDIESDKSQDKTISNAMIAKYNNHKKQLRMLKELIKDTCKNEYNDIFRKENNKASYSNYIKNIKKYPLEDFNKNIKKILDKYSDAKKHRHYNEIYQKIIENKLLEKVNTTDNAVIPYQLHKLELERIIDNQSGYYPFLGKNKGLLIKILESRLPYYIGPLNRQSNFAWNIPIEEIEKNEKLYPWNYEKFIDIDKTAEEFIKAMTNKCTYLRGKDVLPRQSLLYSEFILLNELNKVKINDNFIDKDIKEEIIEDIFKVKKTVKIKDIEEWIRKNPNGFIKNYSDEIIIEGTQGENEFAASLSSYCDFKKILGKIDERNLKMIEEIISWITIFEDKKILKRKIINKYKLDKTTVEKIVKLNYSGWGRLSKKLIDGLRVQRTSKYCGDSIIEIMRKTNYNFMQIINDKKFGFGKMIDLENPEIKKGKIEYEDIKELQGSPAIKRGIWQTVKIIDEIVKVMGSEPKNIFIEFAREDMESKRTSSRASRMKKIYDEIKKDVTIYNDKVYKELANYITSKNKLDARAVYLYFTQNGKCMYTGKDLSLENLNKYQIDHIIPRSYVKDDSFDNLVLVLTESNQDKRDNLLIEPNIQVQQKTYWEDLYKYGLISKKKLENLNRTNIPDRQIMGFINRQLVETRQISKYLSDLLSEVYRDTNIMAIRAKLVSDYRKQYDLYKNRNINDYHHAHDALIVSTIGNFVIRKYPSLEDEMNIKKYIKWYKDLNMHKNKKNKYGFILSSMSKDYSDFEFRWNKDEEIKYVKEASTYKDCFITKKVEEQNGMLFDETIYPCNNSKAKIPIKKGLDPKKYGGYSSVKAAYYVAIEYLKGKRIVKKIVSIPRMEKKRVEEIGLKNYLTELEKIKNKDTLKILKTKIKRYQLIEYQGQEVYFISEGEQQNARQLIVDDKYKELLFKIQKRIGNIETSEKEKFKDVMIEFYDYFIEKLIRHYPLYHDLAGQLKDSKEDFIKYDFDTKIKFLNEMLNITKADSQRGNFKGFNTIMKKADAGRLRKSWKIEDMIFVDKSITGLFERRYRL